MITKFEKEYGYKVNYKTFDSNEVMLIKIQQSGIDYDVATPSEYMIQKMIKEELVLPLGHSRIKGLNNIGPQFLDLDFDPDDQHSIPYFQGALGIVYNDKFSDANQIEHWDDLQKPELKDSLMLIDGAQEVMGLSLNSLGCSLGNKNMAQLTGVANKLNHLTPNVKAIVADEIKMYMINEEASVAVTFSGEAADTIRESEHLHYVTPPEGFNLWFDNIVTPKTVKSKEGAYDFIDFMLKPENAAQNAEYTGYFTPNEGARVLLPKDISSNEQFYPSDDMIPYLEVYKDLGPKYLGTYNDLSLEPRMCRR